MILLLCVSIVAILLATISTRNFQMMWINITIRVKPIWLRMATFLIFATEINLVSILTDWWVDTRVTKHTCGTKCVFSTYTDSWDGKSLFKGNSSTSRAPGKGLLSYSSLLGISLLLICVAWCQRKLGVWVFIKKSSKLSLIFVRWIFCVVRIWVKDSTLNLTP